MTHRALYYPYIRFHDESWLKAGALYWDQIGRIVPYGTIAAEDSETVNQLRAADIVADFPSAGAEGPVGIAFHDLVERWKHPLRHRFSVDRTDVTRVEPARFARPTEAPALLDYVHVDKMAFELRDLLLREHLAVGDDNGAWLGMHPRLVAVYMTALAQVMAVSLGASPLTDDVVDHVAVAGLDLAWIAQALLSDSETHDLANPDGGVEAVIVSLAFAGALPAGIANMRVDEVLQLRRENVQARIRLQVGIAELAGRLSNIDTALSPHELDWHITNEYEKHVVGAVQELKQDLSDNHWQTARSLINIQVALPALVGVGLDSAGFAPMGPVGVAGGIAWSAWTAVGEGRARDRASKRASWVSYLLAIEDAGGTSRLARKVRGAVRTVQAGAGPTEGRDVS